jgi:hypothetical protein
MRGSEALTRRNGLERGKQAYGREIRLTAALQHANFLEYTETNEKFPHLPASFWINKKTQGNLWEN